MVTKPEIAESLARTLVLDELFDLSLYKALRDTTSGDLQRMLDELIPMTSTSFATSAGTRTGHAASGQRKHRRTPVPRCLRQASNQAPSSLPVPRLRGRG
jgi:hypothetical protein